MINKTKQVWAVGSTVKVGFMAGLLVLAAVPTPGDYMPDAYLLSRNNQFYSFVPHNGLTKIDESEARQMVADAKKQANYAAADALAKAQQAARHSEVVVQLMA